jgi:hypothetical protein
LLARLACLNQSLSSEIFGTITESLPGSIGSPFLVSANNTYCEAQWKYRHFSVPLRQQQYLKSILGFHSLGVFFNKIFRIPVNGLANKIQYIMKASQTKDTVYRPLATRKIWPDVHHDIIVGALVGFLMQTFALLVA